MRNLVLTKSPPPCCGCLPAQLKEAKQLPASDYLSAAHLLMAPPQSKQNLFLATSSPAAADAVRQGLGPEDTVFLSNLSHVPDEDVVGKGNYWIATSITSEHNFLEAFADVWDVTHGDGAVLTYSSNVGRWIYWYRFPEFKLGRFPMTTLDGGVPRSGTQ